jgi:hypothetical protein
MFVDYTDFNKQQTLPEGSLLAPMHRPSHRLCGWLCPALFPRLLVGLSPDRSQGRRSDQDSVHHPLWSICLHNHVLRVEERKSHILVIDPIMTC